MTSVTRLSAPFTPQPASGLGLVDNSTTIQIEVSDGTSLFPPYQHADENPTVYVSALFPKMSTCSQVDFVVSGRQYFNGYMAENTNNSTQSYYFYAPYTTNVYIDPLPGNDWYRYPTLMLDFQERHLTTILPAYDGSLDFQGSSANTFSYTLLSGSPSGFALSTKQACVVNSFIGTGNVEIRCKMWCPGIQVTPGGVYLWTAEFGKATVVIRAWP